jgi:hypothetical protein
MQKSSRNACAPLVFETFLCLVKILLRIENKVLNVTKSVNNWMLLTTLYTQLLNYEWFLMFLENMFW